MRFLGTVGVLLRKDLLLAVRAPETLVTMGAFGLLVLVLFVLGLEGLPQPALRMAVPAALWTALFFAGTVGLNRLHSEEAVDGRLFGLLLAPVDRSAVFIAKVAANWILLAVIALVLVPLFFAFFDLPAAGGAWRWALLTALVLLGFSAVGTLLATVTMSARASALLLPVVLFPLLVPLLLAALELSQALLLDGGWGAAGHWLRLLMVYDVLFVVVPWLLFEHVLEL